MPGIYHHGTRAMARRRKRLAKHDKQYHNRNRHCFHYDNDDPYSYKLNHDTITVYEKNNSCAIL